ncbi:MAG: SGNH/GDSL hydrolase family protein [Oscillospiraceae bacterium]|nr:SGNH/GDSL hydrolase family protein [Oscillospiraceae bacterium]
MNLTIYGDSILKGVLYENGRYVLERGWQERLGERLGLQVTNRSRFGSTLPRALKRIEADAQTEAAEGEYALLELGGNDCDYDWKAVSEAPEREHLCHTPPQQFADCCRRAIRVLRESGRTPLLSTLPPVHAERYLSFLCRGGLSRDNLVRFLGDVQHIYRWQESYSELVEQLSREEDTPLIDLRRPFLQDSRPLDALLCSDGIHPSRQGQELLYQAVCAAL